MQVLTVENTTRFSPLMTGVGFFAGLFLSFFVLSGDEEGRVNLLYLLIVFLLIPVMGAFISIMSLFGKKGANVARLLSVLPVWSKEQQNFIVALQHKRLDKPWYFLQSHGAAMAYSFSSLLVFFILLFATDINFVWRSTLLDAQDLLPVLKVISTPWYFWEAAQPSLDLLQTTQDSRLNSEYQYTDVYGQWWAFVLAIQVFYSLILRGSLVLVALVWLRSNDRQTQVSPSKPAHNAAELHKVKPHHIAPLTSRLPCEYGLINWAGFGDDFQSVLHLAPTDYLEAGPLHSEKANQVALKYDGDLILLVKAWEPPLAELKDFMQQSRGFIYPINIVNNAITAPETKHIEEWQRFVAQSPGWKIYSSISEKRDD